MLHPGQHWELVIVTLGYRWCTGVYVSAGSQARGIRLHRVQCAVWTQTIRIRRGKRDVMTPRLKSVCRKSQ